MMVNPGANFGPGYDGFVRVNLATSAERILAAERHRRRTGEGQYIKVSLADVAMAMVGNLGYIGEAQVNHEDHYSFGNYLYGAFGRDFLTKEGRRIMIVALTLRQWRSLVEATGLGEAFETLERMLDVDLEKEGDRFVAREVIGATLKPWTTARTLDEIREVFDAHGVCWGPYQTFMELVDGDPRCSTDNPMFDEVEQPGIGSYLMAGSPLDFGQVERVPVRGRYRGFDVAGCPPPSGGGIHLIELLNILEGDDIGALGFGTADGIHLLAETMKLAFADRDAMAGIDEVLGEETGPAANLQHPRIMPAPLALEELELELAAELARADEVTRIPKSVRQHPFPERFNALCQPRYQHPESIRQGRFTTS